MFGLVTAVPQDGGVFVPKSGDGAVLKTNKRMYGWMHQEIVTFWGGYSGESSPQERNNDQSTTHWLIRRPM